MVFEKYIQQRRGRPACLPWRDKTRAFSGSGQTRRSAPTLLECQAQGDADGTAVIDVLLIEAVEEPPEIRVTVERGNLDTLRGRIDRQIERPQRRELDVARRTQRVIEDIVELCAQL